MLIFLNENVSNLSFVRFTHKKYTLEQKIIIVTTHIQKTVYLAAYTFNLGREKKRLKIVFFLISKNLENH